MSPLLPQLIVTLLAISKMHLCAFASRPPGAGLWADIWSYHHLRGIMILRTPPPGENFSELTAILAPYDCLLKGGRVMIAFFVNYSTVAFPLHLPTLKRQQFFGAVANSLGKNSYFPLPLDVRRCVAPTGEEVDARQRGVN